MGTIFLAISYSFHVIGLHAGDGTTTPVQNDRRRAIRLLSLYPLFSANAAARRQPVAKSASGIAFPKPFYSPRGPALTISGAISGYFFAKFSLNIMASF
jgi:hypothetical protein